MLRSLLARRHDTILERWRRLIVETYAPDTAAFLRREPDPFANPVGGAIVQETEGLLDALLSDLPVADSTARLDRLVRIRAVQSFTPAQAVAFAFLLKRAVRESLSDDLSRPEILPDLLALESRIDEMACLAFDLFVVCREKIYDIRANELRSRTQRLLDRLGADATSPDPVTGSDPK